MAIKYGPRSRANIDTLHPTLARVLYDYADMAPASLDITVTDGHRGEAAQTKAFNEGKSTLPWPKSGHNSLPSRAFDFCAAGVADPYNRTELLLRQGALRLVAAQRGIKLKPIIDGRGASGFVDLPHLELADPE